MYLMVQSRWSCSTLSSTSFWLPSGLWCSSFSIKQSMNTNPNGNCQSQGLVCILDWVSDQDLPWKGLNPHLSGSPLEAVETMTTMSTTSIASWRVSFSWLSDMSSNVCLQTTRILVNLGRERMWPLLMTVPEEGFLRRASTVPSTTKLPSTNLARSVMPTTSLAMNSVSHVS